MPQFLHEGITEALTDAMKFSAETSEMFERLVKELDKAEPEQDTVTKIMATLLDDFEKVAFIMALVQGAMEGEPPSMILGAWAGNCLGREAEIIRGYFEGK
jgi:hypothetical protein